MIIFPFALETLLVLSQRRFSGVISLLFEFIAGHRTSSCHAARVPQCENVRVVFLFESLGHAACTIQPPTVLDQRVAKFLHFAIAPVLEIWIRESRHC